MSAPTDWLLYTPAPAFHHSYPGSVSTLRRAIPIPTCLFLSLTLHLSKYLSIVYFYYTLHLVTAATYVLATFHHTYPYLSVYILTLHLVNAAYAGAHIAPYSHLGLFLYYSAPSKCCLCTCYVSPYLPLLLCFYTYSAPSKCCILVLVVPTLP